MGIFWNKKRNEGSAIIGYTPRSATITHADKLGTNRSIEILDQSQDEVSGHPHDPVAPPSHSKQKTSSSLKLPATEKLSSGPSGETRIADWYFSQLQEIARNQEAENARIAKRGNIFGIAGAGFALVAFIGAACVVILNRPNPPAVLRVDNATGEVTVLPTTGSGKISWDEKNDRADLKKYVESRESYDFEQINDMHDRILLMSSSDEGKLYDSWLRKSPHSPLNAFKESYRIIAKYSAITFVGNTAQVYFSRRATQAKETSHPNVPVYYGIATVAFETPDVAQLTKASDDNPRNFRVTSYTVHPDHSRMTAAALAFWGE